MGLDPLLVAGQLFSFSTLMLLVGFLTCKTVSRMTYTVLVETLNPTHSPMAAAVLRHHGIFYLYSVLLQ